MLLIIGILCLVIMILVFMYQFVKGDLEELDYKYDSVLSMNHDIDSRLKKSYSSIRYKDKRIKELEDKIENYERNIEILSNSYNNLVENYSLVVSNLTPARKNKLGL